MNLKHYIKYGACLSVLLLLVLAIYTVSNNKQADTNKSNKITATTGAKVHAKKLPQVKYLSTKNKQIKGSFSYSPDAKMSQSTIRLLSNEYPVVDSYNTEPPFKKFGVWQGLYNTTRKKQIYLVAHAGFGIGNLLFKLKPGDIIETSDVNNHKRNYEVKYSRDLNDYGVSYTDGKDYYDETVNQTNKDRLIMQTCYNDTKNLILYCYPVSQDKQPQQTN